MAGDVGGELEPGRGMTGEAMRRAAGGWWWWCEGVRRGMVQQQSKYVFALHLWRWTAAGRVIFAPLEDCTGGGGGSWPDVVTMEGGGIVSGGGHGGGSWQAIPPPLR